jgi:hypothetical protein
MFKKDQLVVKLEKRPGEDGQSLSTPVNWDAVSETLLGGTLVVIAGYMACDTLRKCIIHTVATKVT